MGLHGLGVLLLGVAPVLGLRLVEGAVGLGLQGLPGTPLDALEPMAGMLTRIGLISAGLAAAIAGVLWLRSRLAQRPGARHVTWGCGYTATNARMQYTGAGFASDFGARFRGVLLMLKRQKAPTGYFPTDAYVITDCVDAVERRLYTVIGHGDNSASELSRQLREDDPRITFALALAAIVVIAGLVVLTGGPLP
jgi:hydrogenase-4 component B